MLVIQITVVTQEDRTFIGFIVICIILTSLVWVGDIFSWFWVGNGFVIDIIIAIIAIAITIATVFLYSKYKKRKLTAQKGMLTDDSIQTHQQFTCFNCGEVVSNKDHCSHCGSPLPVCIVCFSDFNKDDIIVQLPCCSNYAHEEHIKNYLNVKGICPKCQQEVKIENLEKISI